MNAIAIIAIVVWLLLVLAIGLFVAAANLGDDYWRHRNGNDRTNEDYLEGDD